MKSPQGLYPEINRHYLNTGEGFLFAAPTLSQTVLGSCVAVTFFCQRLALGGITHALMPAWRDYEARITEATRYKFVDSGIEGIFELLLDRGVQPREIECKIFGGATSDHLVKLSVAPKNVKVAFETLGRLKLRLAASHVGGKHGRKLFFCSHTGEVFVRSFKNGQGQAAVCDQDE